jgi:hypothetical protein
MLELKAYFSVAELCYRADYALPSCHDYRIHVLVAFAAALLLLLGSTFVGWRFFQRRRQVQDLVALREWETRNQAAEVTGSRWRGDEVTDSQRDVGQITNEIRHALNSRKLNGTD